MPAFRDCNNRDWLVSLDGPNIREVRSKLGIDPITGDAYTRMRADVLLLQDVLAILCLPQIQNAKIDSDDFRRAIKGDVLDTAIKAFHEAQLDFSPSDQREVLRAVVAETEKVRTKQLTDISTRMKSPEYLSRIEAIFDEGGEKAAEEALTALRSAMNLPASAESIPEA